MWTGLSSVLVLPSPKSHTELLYLNDEFENSTLKSFLPEVGSAVNNAAGGDAETVT